jgi:sulfotransferase
LLAALLRQNPRFSAGMSSPVYALFRSMLQEASARNEGSCSSTMPSASGS